MYKLLVAPLILFTMNVFGQSAPVPSGPDITFIIPVQMGTDTIKNGKDTIKLADETIMEMSMAMADSNYVVTLTSIGNCGQLTVAKISHAYFIVKEQNGSSVKELFDYVIYAKQKRPMMPVTARPKQQHPAPGSNK